MFHVFKTVMRVKLMYMTKSWCNHEEGDIWKSKKFVRKSLSN